MNQNDTKKKRLYIEAEGESESVAELNRSKRAVHEIKGYLEGTEQVFNTELFDQMYSPQEAWEAVKAHDEIYCNTSLVPLMGSMGAPVLFNNLMYMAIEEKIEGKRIFIINQYKSIWWDQLKDTLVRSAFVDLKNELYVLTEDGQEFERVDILKLLNNELS